MALRALMVRANVSPDGRWLAFARVDTLSSTSAIWIVELDP